MERTPRNVEAALRLLHAPDARIHPFALVGEDGWPVIRYRSNGTKDVATYRTLKAALVATGRWGGSVWDRTKGDWM